MIEPPPAPAHEGERVLGGEEGAGHVDREDAVPLVEGGVLDGLLDLDAGRVDEHVETAVGTLDAGHQLDGALFARDVVAVEDDGARRGTGISRSRGLGLREAGRVHRRPLGREPRANGRPDPAAAPGDDRHLPGKVPLADGAPARARAHDAPAARR